MLVRIIVTDINQCSGHYHFCMTFDLEKESYIYYAFRVPYEVHVKDFSKFHCFPPLLSSWLSSIHLLEIENLVIYIKSCVLIFSSMIWTSFMVFPKQTLAQCLKKRQKLTIMQKTWNSTSFWDFKPNFA